MHARHNSPDAKLLSRRQFLEKTILDVPQVQRVLVDDAQDRWLPILLQAAMLSALNYVLSLSLLWLVNIKPIFALLFVCAGVWGMKSSLLTALFGMMLWTFANPFGPAPLPVAITQVGGAVLSATMCALLMPAIVKYRGNISIIIAGCCGFLSTGLFFLCVNGVDAWVNQPFMPWFVTGMLTSLIPIGLHAILFPLLVPVVIRLRKLNVGGNLRS